MPLFHAAGLYMAFWFSIYYAVPIALGIADRPLSSDLVVETLKNADVEAAVLPPAILEDMSLNHEAMKQLAKLHAVGLGGGSQPPWEKPEWEQRTNSVSQVTWLKKRATGSSRQDRA